MTSRDGYIHDYVLFVIQNEGILHTYKIHEKYETFSFQLETTDIVTFVVQGLFIEKDDNEVNQEQIISVSASYVFRINNGGVDKQKIFPTPLSETLQGEIDKITLKMLK